MSLDMSRPFEPGDRVQHSEEGWLGTVKEIRLSGLTLGIWSCIVAFDLDKGRTRHVFATSLDPAPRHVPFACIVNPLRRPAELVRSTGPRHPDGSAA